ncbi:MAG: hypothetical protein ACFFKA_12950 [Candidatus Thorarchaeota archaeon]
MDKEIKRIDEKVRVQLQMLNEHESRRDEYFKEKFREENSRPRPRITYIQEIEYRLMNSKLITEAARELMEFTTEWNTIKKGLDDSCDMETGDPDRFERALIELENIKPRDLFDKIARVKRIPRWRKLESPLRTDLINQYEFMQRVYKNAPKYLKRMRMSEAQRRAADSASLRMKIKWGSF